MKATEYAAGYDVVAIGFSCLDIKKNQDIKPVFTEEYIEKCPEKPCDEIRTIQDNVEGFKEFLTSAYNIFFTQGRTVMKPFTRVFANTDMFFALPENFECQVRSRSGLASRGLIVAQGVGTIDSDYRGEIKVCLNNLSMNVQTLDVGDRVAQLVFSKVDQIEFESVKELPKTNRGQGGFGSTGK